jgi:transcription elongation factor GreB
MTAPPPPGEVNDDDAEDVSLPVGVNNYMTPQGHQRLKQEALQLLDQERPALVQVVRWAAANGDRSENADYIYGKRRLREIDRRIRFLTKRLDNAVVVDPAAREHTDQVFFGASVIVCDDHGKQSSYSIVGIDEADVSRGRISWISPLARALLKRSVGDSVSLRTPAGEQTLEIVSVEYRAIDA